MTLQLRNYDPALMAGAADALTTPQSITDSSSQSLAVGPNGATNPVFNVDSSTASAATGITVKGAAAAAGVAVTVISSGTDENLKIDAKGAGTITLNGTATGAVTITPATTITGALSCSSTITGTSTSASALAVGRQGATNPVLKVNANTASVLTGLQITGAGTGNGVAVAVIETGGTNNNLTIDAMGSGTLTLNGTATGNVVAGRALTGVSASMTGAFTGKSGTAIPATAGAVAAGAPLVMNSDGVTIEWTTNAPTHTRIKGSVCINTGGNSSSTRMYIATDSAGTWTNVTTAA